MVWGIRFYALQLFFITFPLFIKQSVFLVHFHYTRHTRTQEIWSVRLNFCIGYQTSLNHAFLWILAKLNIYDYNIFTVWNTLLCKKTQYIFSLNYTPSLLASDPIRVQSCVWCLFWTNRNIMAVISIFLSISLSNQSYESFNRRYQ